MAGTWRRAALIALCSGTLWSGNGWAQQAAGPDDANEDALSPKRLAPISVTATRTPINAADYPGMVTVLDREQIELRQASSPDDVLSHIPNVEFTGGPRRTGEVPSIRGFSGSDLVILVDGARQNLNAGHDGRFFIDPSMLREVEVLRGPASALYGSGGTGGVIAFRTLDAADVLEGDETAALRFSTGYQTVDREESVSLSGFWRPLDSVDIAANVVYRDPGSIQLGDGSELTRSDDDILSGLFKSSYDAGRGHEFEFSFLTFRNDAKEPNVGQGGAEDDIVDKQIANDTARLNWRYDRPGDPLVDLDAQVYYTRSEVDETRLDNNGAGAQGERLTREVNTVGFRADNRSKVDWLGDGAATLVYGLEGYQDIQDGTFNGGERDGVPDSRNQFAGAFGQAEIRLSEPFGAGTGDFLILPGLRFDYFASKSAIGGDITETAVSPRIGATWHPVPWAMVFGNYARAFRAPGFDEAFLDGVHFVIPVGLGITNRFVPNPDLRSQRTGTVEVGFGLDFQNVLQQGDQVFFKATRFRTRANDFIDLQINQPTPFVDCNPFIPGNCDGTTQAVNIPEALLEGNEIEASYDSRRARFAFGFSNLDGNDLNSGDKLGVLTPAQVTFDMTAKFPDQGMIAGFRTLAAFDFDKVDDAADVRAGYVVHDVYFAWQQPVTKGVNFRLDLGIDNITDRAYARVFNDAFEPGRNFKGRVGITARW
ncbi:TonB-dependent receptor domain-containing protein [Minwuia sp.]|uniref:TonB-dependent receptor domain-containing protein n=1 Tax=Minwuia sp. TaxID=2493630 RepID=UPI003A90DC04